jgi:hypothetical protein
MKNSINNYFRLSLRSKKYSVIDLKIDKPTLKKIPILKLNQSSS